MFPLGCLGAWLVQLLTGQVSGLHLRECVQWLTETLGLRQEEIAELVLGCPPLVREENDKQVLLLGSLRHFCSVCYGSTGIVKADFRGQKTTLLVCRVWSPLSASRKASDAL